jgi:hypothetical protein
MRFSNCRMNSRSTANCRTQRPTDWAKIVSLYDSLMTIRPSPVVALNRAIAIAQRDGPDRGIEAIQAITDRDRLKSYPFYWAALGEFELRFKRYGTAHSHFRSALALARNEASAIFQPAPTSVPTGNALLGGKITTGKPQTRLASTARKCPSPIGRYRSQRPLVAFPIAARRLCVSWNSWASGRALW